MARVDRVASAPRLARAVTRTRRRRRARGTLRYPVSHVSLSWHASDPSPHLPVVPSHAFVIPCRPKQISEIRDFLQTARRKDAKGVKIMRVNNVTKFKIRCSKASGGPYTRENRARRVRCASSRETVHGTEVTATAPAACVAGAWRGVRLCSAPLNGGLTARLLPSLHRPAVPVHADGQGCGEGRQAQVVPASGCVAGACSPSTRSGRRPHCEPQLLTPRLPCPPCPPPPCSPPRRPHAHGAVVKEELNGTRTRGALVDARHTCENTASGTCVSLCRLPLTAAGCCCCCETLALWQRAGTLGYQRREGVG